MLILPAIDLRGGKCVRLRQGDFAQEVVYSEDPSQIAAQFAADGAEWIHVVDLDGARSGSSQNLAALERIVKSAGGAKVQFGGGIREVDDASRAVAAGASRIVVGSQLALSPDTARDIFAIVGEGAVAGIDARDGLARVHGWTGETQLAVTELIKRAAELGAKRAVVTDIGLDGMLEGPNIEFLRDLNETSPLPIVASGGVGSIRDVEALAELGIESAIVGKALYEARFSLRVAIAAAQSPSVP